jgi:xanthine dehydrogenase YagR molybdenum-binding subunit
LATTSSPFNADNTDIDVVSAGAPDPLTPLDAKGLGEIGLVGIAAAIANAVRHATRRIRSIQSLSTASNEPCP